MTLIFAVAVACVVVYLPALFIGEWLRRVCALPAYATLLAGFVAVCALGYAQFWIYFGLRPAATVLSELALVALTITACVRVRARPNKDALRALALVVGVSMFYGALLGLHGPAANPETRFFAVRPNDDDLPRLFAEHLWDGSDLRSRMGVWQGSDRPPLQSGVYLVVRPIADVPAIGGRMYEACGIALQCSWVCALWFLCGAAGLDKQRRGTLLALAVLSGFFFFNSVYVWPKLVAASLAIAAIGFVDDAIVRRSPRTAVLAGIAAGASLVSHPATAFFLLSASVALAAWKRPAFFLAARFCAAALALAVPWSLYQHLYDPPATFLAKMHLAGVTDPGDSRSLTQAVIESYAAERPARILSAKLEDMRTVAGAGPLLAAARTGESNSVLNTLRLLERESMGWALGIVNVGWVLVPSLWRRRAFATRSDNYALASLALGLVSMLFWILAEFGSGWTVMTHAAYAMYIAIFFGLSLTIVRLPAHWRSVVLGLAALDFGLVWLYGSEEDARVVSGPHVSATCTLVAVSLAIAGVVALQRSGAFTDVEPSAVSAS